MKKPVKKAAAKKAPAGRLAVRAATAKKPTKVVGKPAKKASKPSVAKTPAKAAVKKAIKSVVAPSAKAKKVAPAKTKASSGKTPASRVSSVKKAATKKAVVKKSASTATQKSASRLINATAKTSAKQPVPAKKAALPASKKAKTPTPHLPVQSDESRSKPRIEQVASTPPAPATSKVALPAKKDLGKVAFAIVRPLTAKDQKPAVTKSSSPAPSTAPDLLENDEGANPGFFQTDEVFDETDYAQHLQLMEQADISRRARELNRPQVHPDFDGEHCIECDIQIPQARLQAGRIRCVDCQEEVENEARRNQNLIRGR